MWNWCTTETTWLLVWSRHTQLVQFQLCSTVTPALQVLCPGLNRHLQAACRLQIWEPVRYSEQQTAHSQVTSLVHDDLIFIKVV